MALTAAYAFLRAARDDGDEQTDVLHPVLAWRLYILLTELWAVHGQRCVTIESAARSLAEQRSLYARYLAGTGNLAANPDRPISSTPIGPVRGSWHMVQGDGHGHAVDLTRPGSRITWDVVHALLPACGLELTVRWPDGRIREPWHVQAVTSGGWVSGPMPQADQPSLPPPPKIRRADMWMQKLSMTEAVVHVPGVLAARVKLLAEWAAIIRAGHANGGIFDPTVTGGGDWDWWDDLVTTAKAQGTYYADRPTAAPAPAPSGPVNLTPQTRADIARQTADLLAERLKA